MGSYLHAAAASKGGGCSHGGYACREKKRRLGFEAQEYFGAMPIGASKLLVNWALTETGIVTASCDRVKAATFFSQSNPCENMLAEEHYCGGSVK
jgi:hypothetical protein